MLITTNYVLLETIALLQRRRGLEAVAALQADLVPSLTVEWIDRERHALSLAVVLTAGRRDLSLVDCVSFQVMRELGLRTAFTLDQDFRDQGFECLPSI